MRIPRQTISLALFNLLKGAYPWKKTDRRGHLWSNVETTEQPAMFLICPGNSLTQEMRGMTRYKVSYTCLIYAHVDPSPKGAPPADLIDQILDAVDAAMQPIAGEANTLNGLVQNAWIEGEIFIDSGILDNQIAIVIPIRVLP